MIERVFSINNKKPIFTIKILYLVIGIVFFSNILLIKNISAYSIEILVVEVVILCSAIFFYVRSKSFLLYLIFIYFIQFIYLNNVFHYHFPSELLLSIPLIVFGTIMIIDVFHKWDFKFRMFTKLELSILAFVLYSFIMAMFGISNGGDNLNVFIEWYHLFYYAYFFAFSYFFKDSKDYHTLFSAILLFVSIMAIEYIAMNFLVLNERFVTFQSNFFPLVLGIFVSSYLYKYRRTVTVLIVLLLIVAMLSTLTRSLWIVTVVVILSVLLVQMKLESVFSLKKIVIAILLCLVPILVINEFSSSSSASSSNSQHIDNRMESLSNASSDLSFLMRVEMTYYALQNFIESPIVGKGLADYQRYKITVDSKYKEYYIDNSWAYILWKGGGIGILLFLMIYIFSMRQMILVAKKTDDLNIKIINIGLFGGFIGMLILASVSPHLIKYKSNLIFPLIFAYVNNESRGLEKEE